MRYVIDADLQDCFGSINHRQLYEFSDHRMKAGVIRRMPHKRLKAGIPEESRVTCSEEGAPQNGSVHPPPLSGNICLHYVPDDRFIKQIQPLTEKEKLSTPLRG
jgi:retron-type reverse transcriptase